MCRRGTKLLASKFAGNAAIGAECTSSNGTSFDWQSLRVLESIQGPGETRDTRTVRYLGTVGSFVQDRVSPDEDPPLDVICFAVGQRSQLDLSLTGLSAHAQLCSLTPLTSFKIATRYLDYLT